MHGHRSRSLCLQILFKIRDSFVQSDLPILGYEALVHVVTVALDVKRSHAAWRSQRNFGFNIGQHARVVKSRAPKLERYRDLEFCDSHVNPGCSLARIGDAKPRILQRGPYDALHRIPDRPLSQLNCDTVVVLAYASDVTGLLARVQVDLRCRLPDIGYRAYRNDRAVVGRKLRNWRIDANCLAL
jgi:hypothetical protein